MDDRAALHAFIANLAYVNWTATDIGRFERVVEAAERDRIAPASATRVMLDEDGAQPWLLRDFTDSTADGFAAAVFAAGNQKVLAIRGTELEPGARLADLLQTDVVEIGLVGLALSQATSLFNYLHRLRAAEGQTGVLRLELNVTPERPPLEIPALKSVLGRATVAGETVTDAWYWFEAHHDATGLGVLAPGDALVVTGHSLGGHLAALALRLFPDWIDRADTFNAAPFDPGVTAWWPDTLLALLQQAVPDSPLAPFVAAGFARPQQLSEALINELFAAWTPATPAPDFLTLGDRLRPWVSEDSRPGDDLDVFSGVIAGRLPGQPQLLPTETNSHSMDPMVDSLAVLERFRALAPTATMDDLAVLVATAASEAGASLEALVESLSWRVLGRDPELPPLVADFTGYPVSASDAGVMTARATLYETLAAIDLALAASPPRTLESLHGWTADELAEAAVHALPFRAALLRADPFVLSGSLPDALLARVGDDAAWHDAARDDRAAWLVARLERNLRDAGTWQLGARSEHFIDHARGEELRCWSFDQLPGNFAAGPVLRRVFGADTAETLTGSAVRDHLYGEGGLDVLTGDAGNDVLDGGPGNDALLGGAGADRLLGGAGDDVLWSARGEGWSSFPDAARDRLEGGSGFDQLHAGPGDRVRDDSGTLWVIAHYGDVRASGKTLELVHESADLRCYRAPQDWPLYFVYLPAREILIANGVVVEDFQSGELGIVLPQDKRVEPARLSRDGTAQADRFLGTAAAENFMGLEGPDEICAAAGDDHGDGGPGADLLLGEAGDDVLLGGEGGDALHGSEGEDALQGGAGRDLLTGDAGGDVLDGGNEGDFIAGGPGCDVLRGGGGHDFLSAAGGVGAVLSGWSFTLVPVPRPGLDVLDPRAVDTWGIRVYDQYQFRTPSRDDADLLFGDDGNDQILGGAGPDWLDGGTGDDIIAGADGDDDIFGGDGLDHLRGGGGSDVIDGGAGNDVLAGHGGDESARDDTEDTLEGGVGDDRLHGGPAADRLRGGEGQDLLFGDEGDDLLDGGSGRDRLEGNDGNDTLEGGVDADWLSGGAGDDLLFGGEGRDTVLGGDGRDTLVGNPGEDILLGGAGDDVYRILRGSRGTRIEDTQGRTIVDLPDLATLDQLHFARDATGLSLWTATPSTPRVVASSGVTDDDSVQLRLEGNLPAALRFGAGGYLPGHRLGAWQDAGRVILYTPEAPDAGTSGHDFVWVAGAGAPDAGAGDDHYQILAEATGVWHLSDLQGDNCVELAWTGALEVRLEGSTLQLSGNRPEQRVVLSGFDPGALRAGPRPLADLMLADGQVFTWDMLIDAVNTAPRVAGPLPVFEIPAGRARRLVLPSGTVMDPDPGDTLRLEWRAPPPSWIQMATTGEGWIANPSVAHAGLHTLSLRAVDARGDGVDLDLDIRVLPPLRKTASAQADALNGTSAAEVMRGLAGGDVMQGFGGADRLEGQAGDDDLRGGAGMDVLLGGPGADWLDGGPGLDGLAGGTGNDSYLFGPGSGRDVVVERAGEGEDTLRLAAGVRPADLLFSRQGDAWVLGLVGRADQLVVSSPLEAPIPLEVLRFADGSRLALSSLAAPASTRLATTADGGFAEAFVALTASGSGLTDTAALMLDDALRIA